MTHKSATVLAPLPAWPLRALWLTPGRVLEKLPIGPVNRMEHLAMAVQKSDGREPRLPVAVGDAVLESADRQGAPKAGNSHLKRLDATAAALLGTAVVQSIPVWCYGDSTAPVWMRAILILAVSQMVLGLWIVLVPDWSALWIATLVTAGASVCFAFALALAVATPLGQPDLLEINHLRDLAQLWLTAMVLVSTTMSFACGQMSFQWRKDTG